MQFNLIAISDIINFIILKTFKKLIKRENK